MDSQMQALIQQDRFRLHRALYTSGIPDLEPALTLTINDLAFNAFIYIHSQNRSARKFTPGIRAPSPLVMPSLVSRYALS